MSNLKIAIIAEDDTDCEAIRRIVHRVLGKDIGTKKWASKGCSILRRKLLAKIKELSREGCNAFVILHDLDRNPQNGSLNDPLELRKKLKESISSFQGIKHICIPIEELEAWFWSDPEVIKHIGGRKGKAEANPDKISKPKEKLIKLSIGENTKPRYSTNMNAELAEMLNLKICADRCLAFKGLIEFLKSDSVKKLKK
jgi:hypothetical protein